MNDKDFFTCYGGRGDGKQLSAENLVGIEEGDIARLYDPKDNPNKAQLYRRKGKKLIFIKTIQIFRFVGGPYDGHIESENKIKIQDKQNVILIPPGSKTSFWYRREGNQMIFFSSEPVSDLISEKDDYFSINKKETEDE